MTWEEIRKQYPHRWLVVEAIDAYTDGPRRVINNLNVMAIFGEDDWKPAWKEYERLHHEDIDREYYPLHTDREELNIGIMDGFGRIVTA
jgi:hypothetical protein